VLRATVVLGHAQIVLEHAVRVVEGVVELVPLEDVVVPARLVRRPMLGVHGAADRPERAFPPLDPNHDALLDSAVVDADDRPFGEAARRRPASHPCLR
jgi:hypothetical protein